MSISPVDNNPLKNNIWQIKNIRNKLLAYNEEVKLDTLVLYETVENLLEHAKNVVSFYSLTYTGIRLKFGDDFYLA